MSGTSKVRLLGYVIITLAILIIMYAIVFGGSGIDKFIR